MKLVLPVSGLIAAPGILTSRFPWIDPEATSGQNETRKALRDQIVLYGGPIPDMPSAPTIVNGTENGAAPGTGSYVDEFAVNKFLVYGRTYQDTVQRRWSDVTYDLDPLNQGAIAGAIGVVYDGQIFRWIDTALNALYHDVIVDGQRLAPNISASNTGAQVYRSIDFGSAASREIIVRGCVASWRWRGLWTEPTRNVIPLVDTRLRTLFLIDSFGEAPLSVPFMLGWELGHKIIISSALGGTGWVQVNGERPNLYDRFEGDCIDTGPWDVIVFAQGFNDINDGNDAAVASRALERVADARAEFPDAVIYVFGPWDVLAPLAPQTGYAAIKAAMQAAVANVQGAYFIDMQGVAYEKIGGGDTTHPSVTTGVASLVAAAKSQILRTIGLYS